MVVALLALATPAAMAGRMAPIEDVVDAPVVWTSKAPADLDVVQGTILMALIERGSTSQLPSPGLIPAAFQKDTHRIEGDMPYDTKAHSIRYRASTDMLYDQTKGEIHRKYDEGVRALQRSIDPEMVRVGP